MAEFDSAKSKMKKGTAPGKDEITVPVEMIEKLGPLAKAETLAHI